MTVTHGGGWAGIGKRQGARYTNCWRSSLGVRGWRGLASRWRTVGVDETSGYGAASRPGARASSTLLLPPPSLVELEGPSLAGPFPFSVFFSTARSPQLPRLVTPVLLRPASNYLDATPSTCHDRLPELPARRRTGRCRCGCNGEYQSLGKTQR